MATNQVLTADQIVLYVQVNGKEVTFPDAKPYYESNRVMIPVRFVSEALGALVSYSSDGQITIDQSGKIISTEITSDSATVGSDIIQLDVPAQLKENRVFVPLRFVSEALGAIVGWNQETHVVSVTTDTYELFVRKDLWKSEKVAKGQNGVF